MFFLFWHRLTTKSETGQITAVLEGLRFRGRTGEEMLMVALHLLTRPMQIPDLLIDGNQTLSYKLEDLLLNF